MKKFRLNNDLREVIVMLAPGNEGIDKIHQELLIEAWVMRAIVKRVELSTITLDKSTEIMILYLGDGIVGKCAKITDAVILYILSQGKLDLKFPEFIEKFTYNLL